MEAVKIKNGIFLVAQPLGLYPPPPSGLVATKFFARIFLELQKTVFLLSGQVLTPLPLLVTFLRLPLLKAILA